MLFFNLKKGVGLLEAVVAIGILITGIISVVSLSLNNNASSQGVESRQTAINLAREGIEAVRSIRDGNWLKGRTNSTGQANAWDTGLSASSDSTAIAVLDLDTLAWTMDFTPTDFTHSGTQMRRHQTRGLYRQTLGSTSGEVVVPYKRLLTIYAICYSPSGNRFTDDTDTCPGGYTKGGIRVISRVEWQERGKITGLEAEEWLSNWRYGFKPYVEP